MLDANDQSLEPSKEAKACPDVMTAGDVLG